jgi:hypothetical protein
MFAALALLASLAACSIPPLKDYAYPAWGFTVSCRAPMTAVETPAAPDGSRLNGVRVTAQDAGRWYIVVAADVPASIRTNDDLLSRALNDGAANAGGELANETYFATGKALGREAFVRKSGEVVARLRVFVWRGRLYGLSTSTPLGPDDALVREFLDSLRLTGT